jgi:hypothetical protein
VRKKADLQILDSPAEHKRRPSAWALPVAGRGFTSETILVMPGQVITWKLENELDTSSLSVY